MSADHPVVSLRRALEREHVCQRAHAPKRAERQRVFGIDLGRLKRPGFDTFMRAGGSGSIPPADLETWCGDREGSPHPMDLF